MKYFVRAVSKLNFHRFPMFRRVVHRPVNLFAACCVVCILWLLWRSSFCSDERIYFTLNPNSRLIVDKDGSKYYYDTDMPIIFIGGVPRSGTTLMRVMLDAHRSVRCGEETRLVPRLLDFRDRWMGNSVEKNRLKEASIDQDVIDRAVASFILEVIVRHGPFAPRLCNKDPFALKSIEFLSSAFPQSKFLLMVRDGRAVAHSIVSRKITISGYDITSYRDVLRRWNTGMDKMYQQCLTVGSDRCLPVYYEKLVLNSRETLKRITSFLGLEWDENVLRHHELIGDEVKLSKTERSSDQVIEPVNLEALSKWVGHIPADVAADLEQIAPMLRTLGYDLNSNSANYGRADALVVNNTNLVRANMSVWDERRKQLLLGIGQRP